MARCSILRRGMRWRVVDARLPDRYLLDRGFRKLTDSERVSFLLATLWSVVNRTDGRIEKTDLDIIPMFRPDAVTALVVQGLWVEADDDAWLIVDYERDQTSRSQFEVLENARRREREKKQRQRSKGDSPGGQSPGTVPGDDTGRTGRTGRKEGQEGRDESAVTEWAVRVPGGGHDNDDEPF